MWDLRLIYKCRIVIDIYVSTVAREIIAFLKRHFRKDHVLIQTDLMFEVSW